MAGFYYVYHLVSVSNPDRHYIGWTEDLESRLKAHNTGCCLYTSKFVPWQLETAVAFRSRAKSIAFEKYLKSHSGRAFASKARLLIGHKVGISDHYIQRNPSIVADACRQS